MPTGAPTTLADEMIQTTLLVALKTINRPKIASKPAEIEEVIPKSKSRPKVASKPAEPEEETPKHTKTSPKPVSRVPVLSATVEAQELP